MSLACSKTVPFKTVPRNVSSPSHLSCLHGEYVASPHSGVVFLTNILSRLWLTSLVGRSWLWFCQAALGGLQERPSPASYKSILQHLYKCHLLDSPHTPRHLLLISINFFFFLPFDHLTFVLQLINSVTFHLTVAIWLIFPLLPLGFWPVFIHCYHFINSLCNLI